MLVKESDKRKVMGKVIEVAILAIMENHFYEFGGKLYKQGTGEQLD